MLSTPYSCSTLIHCFHNEYCTEHHLPQKEDTGLKLHQVKPLNQDIKRNNEKILCTQRKEEVITYLS